MKRLRQIVEISDKLKSSYLRGAVKSTGKMAWPKVDKRLKWIGKTASNLSDKQVEKSIKETLTETDTISLTVPLFIRMLEYAKEDAKTDMDLHKATEKIISLSDGEDTLDMDSYSKIVEEVELDELSGDTYASYIPKAYKSWKKEIGRGEAQRYSMIAGGGNWDKRDRAYRIAANRNQGIERAGARLADISSSPYTPGDPSGYEHRKGHKNYGGASKKDIEKFKKAYKEEVELDEAKIKRKAVSQRVNIKTKGDIAKEKAARMKLMKAAIRNQKETGEKVQFKKFRDWRSIRKSAREKMES